MARRLLAECAMPIMTLVGSGLLVYSIALGHFQLGLAAASLIIAVVAARVVAMALTAPFSYPSDLVYCRRGGDV